MSLQSKLFSASVALALSTGAAMATCTGGFFTATATGNFLSSPTITANNGDVISGTGIIDPNSSVQVFFGAQSTTVTSDGTGAFSYSIVVVAGSGGTTGSVEFQAAGGSLQVNANCAAATAVTSGTASTLSFDEFIANSTNAQNSLPWAALGLYFDYIGQANFNGSSSLAGLITGFSGFMQHDGSYTLSMPMHIGQRLSFTEAGETISLFSESSLWAQVDVTRFEYGGALGDSESTAARLHIGGHRALSARNVVGGVLSYGQTDSSEASGRSSNSRDLSATMFFTQQLWQTITATPFFTVGQSHVDTIDGARTASYTTVSRAAGFDLRGRSTWEGGGADWFEPALTVVYGTTDVPDITFSDASTEAAQTTRQGRLSLAPTWGWELEPQGGSANGMELRVGGSADWIFDSSDEDLEGLSAGLSGSLTTRFDDGGVLNFGVDLGGLGSDARSGRLSLTYAITF